MAKDFLIIGDSHSCGAFGKVLAESLKVKNFKSTLYCTPGSSAIHWNRGQKVNNQICQTMNSEDLKLKNCGSSNQHPSVEELLKNHTHSHVIFALGTNSLLSSEVDQNYVELAQKVSSADRECLWIGPPNFNENQAVGFPKSRILTLKRNLTPFYNSLDNKISSNCKLIDSREATAPSTPGYDTADGIHRTPTAGRYWATQISQLINE